jgi:putative CocE/NonD family hydrolase
MIMIQKRSNRNTFFSFVIMGILARLVMAGCSGSNGPIGTQGTNIISLSTTTSSLQTTTLGTRGSVSQPNPPVTSNANASWTNYSRSPDYPGAVTLPLQFITTSAGDKLAVLVSVPANAYGNPVPGKFPVILTQTAYRIDLGNLLGTIVPADTTLLIGGQDKFMITRGYITVAVDVFGTGMSSGITQLLGVQEQAAYGDTVNWITRQPWFDGYIGVAGTSYLGISALLTAEQQNPAVKAVFAEVPMGDPYRGTVAPGGLLNANFISLWLSLTQNLSVANIPAEIAHPQYALQIAAATQQHVQAINDWYLPTINQSLDGVTGYATDDGSFWSVRSPLENAGIIRVPTFIVGGSNDLFQRDEPLLYEQLKNNVTTKLLILPGGHVEAILDSLINHNNSVSTGAPSSETIMLQWFDQYLKGMNTGAASMPDVTQYVEGYGLSGIERYAGTTDWPSPLAEPLRMYLHGNMSLSTSTPSSDETAHIISEPSPASISVNAILGGTLLEGTVTPNDGSSCSSSEVQWSLGIAGLLPLTCYNNDTTVEQSQHALVFTTAPYNSNFYINGPIEADIWMSATNPEAAIAVRVDDVDVYGNATPLSTGIQSAAYRAVDTSRSRYIDGVMIQPWHPFTLASKQPLIPNQPVLVRVEIFPAAALLRPGHKLQIAMSSGNQAEGVWAKPDQTSANGNVTTIYNDAVHPSSVVLPVVPASVLN